MNKTRTTDDGEVAPQAAEPILLDRHNNRANNVIIVDSATNVVGHLADADEIVIGDSWEILQAGEGSLTVTPDTLVAGQEVILNFAAGAGLTTKFQEYLTVRCSKKKGKGPDTSVVLTVGNGNIVEAPVNDGSLKLTVRAKLPSQMSFKMPTKSGFNYVGTVDWGDGTPVEEFTAFDNALWTHVYAEAGDYQITITGVFECISFSNSGGAPGMLISVDQWGDVGAAMVEFKSAFYGCSNLVSLPDDMTLAGMTDGSNAFNFCTKLTTLPEAMTLDSLTSADSMFSNCAKLTTLPEALTLAALRNGTMMFYGCNTLTDLPEALTLAALTNGTNMFNGCTINTADYSALLVRMEAANPNTGVYFHGGLSSQYDATGEVARNALKARVPAWSITDGGLAP